MPTRPPRSAPPRSLADDLRSRSDDDLAALLRERPDLLAPLPADIGALAARATTRAGVQRALERLDTAALQVAEVMAVLPDPTTATQVRQLWGADARVPLGLLRRRALVWGGERALRLVGAARESLGPHPAGLGPTLHESLERRSPSRLAELLADHGLPPTGDAGEARTRLANHLARPDVVRGLLDGAPEGAREILGRMQWGPPTGAVQHADRPVRTGTATAPLDWLLAQGMLAVADPGHVVLPREIAIVLRGGRVHAEPSPAPPAVRHVRVDATRVDATGAAAAAETVRLVAELCEAWGLVPAPVLRAGGIGVRDLRRTAASLDVDEAETARVLELALAAGLLADDGEAGPRWMPTPTFDEWSRGTTGQRWVVLADAWLATTRSPALVGTRDARGGPRNALGPEVERAGAPLVRAAVLAAVADVPAGVGVTDPDLRALLRWRTPRRSGGTHDDLVTWALAEAAALGVVAQGSLTEHGRGLLAGPAARDAAAEALDAALPHPVDHLLLQADLTAVAPGPVVPELARDLALLADVESRGGATVYRFSSESLRRALDAGLSAQDVMAVLERASRTQVPQPLSYLVHDTARRFGRVRVGEASAYLRSDDEAVLSELLVDRRAATLHLRRLAPTVAVTTAAPADVLRVLREAGLAPAAEGAAGELVVHRPDSSRTSPRRAPRPVGGVPPPPSDVLVGSAVAALRAGDLAPTAPSGATDAADMPSTDPATALLLLREAAARRERVWIRYVDGEGRPLRRLVEPLTIEGGRVRAVDEGAGEVRSFSVHRVTGVAPAT